MSVSYLHIFEAFISYFFGQFYQRCMKSKKERGITDFSGLYLFIKGQLVAASQYPFFQNIKTRIILKEKIFIGGKVIDIEGLF